jgi:hypothetical protein
MALIYILVGVNSFHAVCRSMTWLGNGDDGEESARVCVCV